MNKGIRFTDEGAVRRMRTRLYYASTPALLCRTKAAPLIQCGGAVPPITAETDRGMICGSMAILHDTKATRTAEFR